MEDKNNQTPQQPQPKNEVENYKEKWTLSEAENIKLKQTLSNLHYKEAGFDEQHKDWIQTILEKENKHLYDEKINETLKDKKFDIFRAKKPDIDSRHVDNNLPNKQDNKPHKLSQDEIDNTEIYIPGIDGK